MSSVMSQQAAGFDKRVLIEARGLGVTYPDGHLALHPADICVGAGEFVVLLGPSGAGKSTLLRALNGLVRPTAGEVRMAGIGAVSNAAALRALRRQVGMVFQQHQLIGRLTVLANVLTGRLGFHTPLRTLLPLPKEDKLIALDSLDRVGLLSHALRRCDQLSGGQQQRVGIARALAQQPRVMLADEPVASLDPATAKRVLQLIHDVCKSAGIAAVVSLHQIELARQFADRIVGLSTGCVVFDGPPAELDARAVEGIYGVTPNVGRQDDGGEDYEENYAQPAAQAA